MAVLVLIPMQPGFGSPLDVFLLCFAACVLLYIINSLFFSIHLPQGVALIREPPRKTSFSLKTRLAYVADCEAIFHEAYQNYSKRGKAVIVPGIGVRYETILPASSMRWALTQPESVLAINEAFLEIDQVYYSLGHTKYVGDAWQANLVRDEMNAVLENIVGALNDELEVAFSARFGMVENDWIAIDLLEMVRMVVAQAASRFTVGLPLCRNEQYLTDALDAVDGFIINAGITFGTPGVLRPLVGRIIGLKTQFAQRKVRKHFESTYHARLETLKYTKDDTQHTEPLDHLQLMLRYAQKERPHELYDIDVMSRRLTASNLGSMHLTSIQVTNMLLNILGSDAEFNTISILRDEVGKVMGNDSKWTKEHISRMIKADSVARETLRCHSFGGRAIFRKVMADNVETDTGVKLPKGTIFSFLSQPAQMDEDNYKEPWKYDPFRFSRTRETATSAAVTKTQTFVTTSPDYLPFGHGKHACPGRFLVDFELKMIIAYVLTNYDIKFPEEYGGKRPANKWLMEASVPPKGVKVLVKRRRDSGF